MPRNERHSPSCLPLASGEGTTCVEWKMFVLKNSSRQDQRLSLTGLWIPSSLESRFRMLFHYQAAVPGWTATSPRHPTNRLVSKNRNNYPPVHIRRIDWQRLLWEVSCTSNLNSRLVDWVRSWGLVVWHILRRRFRAAISSSGQNKWVKNEQNLEEEEEK